LQAPQCDATEALAEIVIGFDQFQTVTERSMSHIHIYVPVTEVQSRPWAAAQRSRPRR
jgi:hypothetical protein